MLASLEVRRAIKDSRGKCRSRMAEDITREMTRPHGGRVPVSPCLGTRVWLMARTWMRKCPRTNCGRGCGHCFGLFKDTDSAWTWTGRGMTVDMAAGGDWTWLRTGRGLTVAADTRAAIRPESC